MPSIIDRVTAHYEKEPEKIEVPEWPDENGTPTVIYAKPLTLSERQKLKKISDDDIELAAALLIMKAKDSKGEPLFTLDDKQKLMRNADSKVIVRISSRILGSEVKDAEGN